MFDSRSDCVIARIKARASLCSLAALRRAAAEPKESALAGGAGQGATASVRGCHAEGSGKGARQQGYNRQSVRQFLAPEKIFTLDETRVEISGDFYNEPRIIKAGGASRLGRQQGERKAIVVLRKKQARLLRRVAW